MNKVENISNILIKKQEVLLYSMLYATRFTYCTERALRKLYKPLRTLIFGIGPDFKINGDATSHFTRSHNSISSSRIHLEVCETS